MKIDGIDPLIMQKIQEQVRQKQVEESRRPAVENRTRGREKPPPWERGRSKRERNRLREEVRRLNETAKKLGLDLDFRLRFNPDRLLVYLHREDEETVVGSFPGAAAPGRGAAAAAGRSAARPAGLKSRLGRER